MNDYAAHWDSILADDSKNQVDIVTSIHEDGINHFLKRSFEIDQTLPETERKFRRVFERTFDTFGDPRKFKVTLELLSPITLKLPPFTTHLSKSFNDKSGWDRFDYVRGPELIAQFEKGGGVVELLASNVSVKMEWPSLTPGQPPHQWTIPPFDVLGQAELQLDQEGRDFFIIITPTFIKFDIPRPALQEAIKTQIKSASKEAVAMLGDCEDKFVDLFIIAANIAAYEQTPKLVTSIKLPVPVIQDRPIQPAAFDISDNVLTIGFGIDKVELDKFHSSQLNTNTAFISSLIEQDVADMGGPLAFVYGDAKEGKIKSARNLVFRDPKELDSKFVRTNAFIKKQKEYLTEFPETESKREVDGLLVGDAHFAIGINEYFFDTIVNSVIPQPRHKCEDEVRLGPVKGYVCHWSAFQNPDITIHSSGILQGAVDVNVGGSIHACVKKFWDCSWRWACAKLAMAIQGRPQLKLKLLPADGIRLWAELEEGGLRIVSNLPFPFNKIIEFFTSIVFKFIIAFINVLVSLLRFFVLKPEFEVESLNLKLQLKNFSSFYFQRTKSPATNPTKNKFVGFKTNIAVTKL